MQFQLTPLNFSTFAQTYAGLETESAFANVMSREYNRIRHEDGRIIVTAAGQEVFKGPLLHVVVAAFQHDTFDAVRRQWYEGTWSPTQEKGKRPDCQSWDGTVPDAGVGKPQAASCAACPHSKKGADGYTACGQRKSFVMYICKVDQQTGAVTADTQTPYVFDASSKTLFSEYEQSTQSGGTHRVFPLMRKHGVTAIEAVVFELGFAQGAKAPVFRPLGGLPVEVARAVMTAAKETSTRALLAPVGAPANALPAPVAPVAAPQLAAPVAPAPVVAPVAAPQVVQTTSDAWAPAVQGGFMGQEMAAPARVTAAPAAAYAQAAPVQAAPAQAAPAQAAAPVAQVAPASNRQKALGAFSTLIGTK